jgi:hypothetical protein
LVAISAGPKKGGIKACASTHCQLKTAHKELRDFGFPTRAALWITRVEEGKIATRLGHREDAKPLGHLPAAA